MTKATMLLITTSNMADRNSRVPSGPVSSSVTGPPPG